MGGVRKGEKPKGQLIMELMAERPDLDTLGMIVELRNRGVEVTESYVMNVRRLVEKTGTWKSPKKKKTETVKATSTVKRESAQAIAERARELYEQGMSYRQIAQRLGVSHTTINKILRDEKPKVLDLSESTVTAKIADMVRRGYKVTDIMARFHVSKSRVMEVRKYLKDNGETLPEVRGRGRTIVVNENFAPTEHEDYSMLTWAGAFRKLMEYCHKHGYMDAYYYAGQIAEDKDMRV